MRLAHLFTFLLLALANDAFAKTRRVKRGSCKPQKPLMSSSQSNSNLGATGQQKPGASLQSLGIANTGGSAKQAADSGDSSGGGGSSSGNQGSSLSSAMGSPVGSRGSGSGASSSSSGGPSGGGSGQSSGGSGESAAPPTKAPGIWSNSTGSTQSGQQNSGGSSGGGSGGASGTGGGSTMTGGSANQTTTGIGAVMSSSFTQYGAGDSFGSSNCNIATSACGWYNNPGYNAAVSENLYGVGPGGGAGETCGKCYQLTATSDQAGNPLSSGGSIIVKVNNLCPKAGNPLCSQDGLSGTNQYGANVNFDICKDDGAAAHFFGGSTGMALGHAVEVDCSSWSGSPNLTS